MTQNSIVLEMVNDRLAKDRRMEAIGLLNLVVPDELNDIESIALRASFLYRIDDGSLAEAFLKEKQRSREWDKREQSVFHHWLGLTFAAAGRLDESLEELEKAMRRLDEIGESRAAIEPVEYQYASILMALGRETEAQRYFDLNLPVACGDGQGTTTAVIRSDLLRMDVTKPKEVMSKKKSGASVAQGLRDFSLPSSARTADGIFLLSADIRYARLYLPMVARQLSKFKRANGRQRYHLHFHGVAVDKSDLGYLENGWSALLTSVRQYLPDMSFTHRSYDLEDAKLMEKRSIFSLERFRVLPALLGQAKCPIFVTDADQIAVRDPSSLIESEVDVMTRYHSGSVANILSVASATLNIFMPTTNSLRFASDLARYCDGAVLDRSMLRWHVDQAALAACIYLSKPTRIGHLPLGVVATDPRIRDLDLESNEEIVFWSATASLSKSSEGRDAMQQFVLAGDKEGSGGGSNPESRSTGKVEPPSRRKSRTSATSKTRPAKRKPGPAAARKAKPRATQRKKAPASAALSRKVTSPKQRTAKAGDTKPRTAKFRITESPSGQSAN